MTGTEDLLRRSLHDRADRTTYEPTLVIDVAARARAMRRTRTRTALVAAAAAVVAVAVPVGLLLGSDDGGAPDPAPEPSVVTATVGPLDDLPQGAAPQVDYVDDRTYVAADGSRTDLPVTGDAAVAAVAPYRGGFLLSTGTLGVSGALVSSIDAEGDTRWSRCGSDQVAVSDDDRVIAYATTAGEACVEGWRSPVLTWGLTDGSGDLAERAAASGERADPVAVTDQEMIYNATDADTGKPLGAHLTPVGGPSVQVPGLAIASAFEPDSRTVAGMDVDGMGVLADVDTGAVSLRLEKNRLPVAFSPDGRYVVSVVFSAKGQSPITVHDARTGAEVLTVAAPQPNGTVLDQWAVAWEDAAHLLVGTLNSSSQAIVRVGLDGDVELATAPGRETLAGFLFPARS